MPTSLRILVAILAYSLLAATYAQEADFILKVNHDRVSLTAKNVTIGKILRALHRQEGIQVHDDFSGQQRVNLHFEQLPMAAVMQQLRQQTGLDYIIRAHQGDDLSGNEVQIYILSGKDDSVPATRAEKSVAAPAATVGKFSDSQTTVKKKPFFQLQVDPFQY